MRAHVWRPEPYCLKDHPTFLRAAQRVHEKVRDAAFIIAGEGELKEATEFHNCVAWSKLAQTIGTYVHKGSKVYVEGRIQTRSWDDPTGVKKYRTEIVAESLILLDKKGDGPAASGPVKDPSAPAESVPPTGPTEEEINIEDIPF